MQARKNIGWISNFGFFNTKDPIKTYKQLLLDEELNRYYHTGYIPDDSDNADIVDIVSGKLRVDE